MLAETLGTKRCDLRPAKAADLDHVVEGISHPSFPTNLPLSSIYRDGQLSSWLQRMCQFNTSTHSAVWAIDLKSGVPSIGQVALIAHEGKQTLSIWLSPVFWGHGYAREAVAAVTRHCATSGAGSCVWAATGMWNEPTAHLLLSLGFTEDSVLDEGYTVDGQTYAVRQFWLSLTKNGALC